MSRADARRAAPVTAELTASASTHRWLMLAVAMLTQNVGAGLTLGALGALSPALSARIHGSNALAATAIALVLLAMGVLAPLVGRVIGRVPLRTIMAAGAICLAAGHLAMSVADGPLPFLASYGLLIGPGVCLLGLVPTTTLVSQWFEEDRGLALGLVTMPIGVLAAPPLVAWLGRGSDLSAIYVAFAAISLALLPAVALVGSPAVQATAPGVAAPSAAPALPPAAVARLVAIIVGLGLLAGAGVMAMGHLAPIGLARGLSLQTASWLTSCFGGCGVLGALLFGRGADRFGPQAALVANGLVQAGAWAMLLGPSHLLTFLATGALGLCGGGVMAVFTALLLRLFGQAAYPRMMGLVSILVVPFTFGAAPLAGLAVDLTGGYRAALIAAAAAAACAALIFSVAVAGRAALDLEL
jgi:MFS family permease